MYVLQEKNLNLFDVLLTQWFLHKVWYLNFNVSYSLFNKMECEIQEFYASN